MDDDDSYSVAIACYWHIVGVSFLYYDHFITLDAEINYIWKRRTLSAYFFFVNRYLGFFSNIPVGLLPFITVSTRVSVPDSVCMRATLVRQILLCATQVVVAAIMIFRMYALYGRSLRVVGLLLGVGAGVVGVVVWSMYDQQSTPSFLQGCHVAIMQTTHVFLSYRCMLLTTPSRAIRLATSWEGVFVLDSTIFGLTVFNAYTTIRRMGSLVNMPLHRLIALYISGWKVFLFSDAPNAFDSAMALANLSNISTFYLGAPLFRGALSTFASCMSVTLVSRLMLNLHESGDAGILTDLTSSIVIRGGRALPDDVVETRNVAEAVPTTPWSEAAVERKAPQPQPTDGAV
ncbi:hypothetical protein C8F04DRAFT_1273094 [Mycena alexandri]|uniref:DUF6533 domain-containing protein n=1 Tax=Mycena alexandri TaxID=1745969 RepID=A0AAD6S7R6_9AGAR|nr:hypothetical protein C8F04DRAFT_1273094 [Mycena alexandri]